MNFISMQTYKRNLLIFFITLLTSFIGSASAGVPFGAITPAQITQFKALAPAQQKTLAQNAGVDLNQVKTQIDNNVQATADTAASEVALGIEERAVESTENEAPDQETQKKDKTFRAVALNHFGYNLFSGEPLTIAPLNDLPVPSNYVLAPGDQINIALYGKENRKSELTVNREGEIVFDAIGPIHVAGMTFSELRKKVKEYISKKMIGVEANVTMGKLRTMQILVLGEAYKPGAYVISSLGTITQSLKAAGGIKQSGSLRNVQIKRKNKVVGQIDLYDWLIKGDTSDDFRLQNGDTIFIPTKGTEVSISGQVRRSAFYELKPKTSLFDAINIAGGIREQSAYTQAILIERPTDKGVVVINIDLNSSKAKQFKLKSGDKVSIKSIPGHYQKEVTLLGNAVRSGVFQWQESMRISDIIRDAEKDLLPLTDLNYALVFRVDPEVRLLKFNLAEALSSPQSLHNLVIHNHDQIIIFDLESKAQRAGLLAPVMSMLNQFASLEKPFRYNAINGAVRFPGKYPLFSGDKISDLVEAAGGFKESSFSLSSQLLQTEEPATAITIETDTTSSFSAELDSSFIFRIEDSVETINFSLGKVLKDTKDSSNIELKNHDAIIIVDSLSAGARNKLLAPMLGRMEALADLKNPMRFVNIVGAVKFPGRYPLPRNTKIREMLSVAGGFQESAYTLRAEISRYTQLKDQSTKLQHQTINVKSLLEGDESQNITLKSRDTIHIFTSPDWLERYSIELTGEVTFPGTYTVARGETIADVIKRAGGITQYGYPKGAIFSRVRLRQKEAQQIIKIRERLRAEVGNMTFRKQSSTNPLSGTDSSQAMAIVEQLGMVEPLGRMVINLDQIIKDNPDQDITIENGDQLVIPALNKVVSVMGHVQVPSSFIFDSSLNVEDYIDQSGGPLQQSDDDRIYVIRANGSVMLPNNSAWFSRSDKPLEPGDTVIVPIDTNYSDPLDTLTAGTQILYQLGVAYSAISR